MLELVATTMQPASRPHRVDGRHPDGTLVRGIVQTAAHR